MRTLRAFLRRLAGLFGGARRDRQLEDEIASHIEFHVADNIRAGMSPDEARRVALVRFGGVEAVKEAYRDRRGIPSIDSVSQDLRHGVRLLRRSPGFAIAAMLSLALGIGANAAIFSILNALLLRTLPVREADRLVQLYSTSTRASWTHPLWEALQSHGNLFDGLAAWSSRSFDLASGGVTDPAEGLVVNAGFFDVLGVPAVLGRTFGQHDDRPGGAADGASAVVSYAFWQQRLAGDPAVVGRTIAIERIPFTIVGVTARGFFGPTVGRSFDVAIPLAAYPSVLRRNRLNERTWWWLYVMARLRPDQSVKSTTAALSAIQPQLREATRPPGAAVGGADGHLTSPISVRAAATGHSVLRGAYRQPLIALMAVVAIILLIACVNIANLLLARADRRAYEVSVRLALGASRGRLLRQFMVESLLLAAIGGAAGLLFAQWASAGLVRYLASADTRPFLDLALDWRVLAFTAALALGVAILFGTLPAIRATGVQPLDALRKHARVSRDAPAQLRAGALVALQIALCLVLVAAAGLFGRTFAALAMRAPGFDRDRVLVMTIDARRSAGPPTARMQLFQELVDRTRAVPGVAGASLSAVTPVSNNESATVLENPAGTSLPVRERTVRVNQVSPGWFGVYGIPLLRGRDFRADDLVEGSSSVIITEALARRFFPGANPVGLTIRESGDPAQPAPALTIVGVVADSVYLHVREVLQPIVFMPLMPASTISLSIRVDAGSPAALAPAVVAAVGRVDPALALRVRPLAEDLGTSVARERLLAVLSGFCGGLALLLASIGLYGVVAYVVGSRRSEIGIRVALGATSLSIVALVVRRVAILAGIGLAVGLGASLWAGRFFGSLLYGVEPHDPWTLAAATALLAGVCAAASWLPARRAARLDPARVLREA